MTLPAPFDVVGRTMKPGVETDPDALELCRRSAPAPAAGGLVKSDFQVVEGGQPFP
jgi:hypothetical protein